MASRFLYWHAVTLLAGSAFAQTVVQPGAPGRDSKVIPASSVKVAPPPIMQADTDFMQGMIHHHAQAVEMVDLLKKYGKSKDLQKFGERIRISQSDEIKFMKNWLMERGKAVPMDHSGGHMEHTPGMQMMDMASMPAMPGMLTAQQMAELRKARGARFDHFFLTGMIQHHKGALTMVQDLFSVAGSGQDAQLYEFATDVDNTQSAEIKIMQGMLDKEKK